MLTTHADYQKIAKFRQTHPTVDVPGDGFFTNLTADQLQKIIDQTLASLKTRRYITGGNNAACTAAGTLLKQAGSADTKNTVWVTWGLHQDTATTARGGGSTATRHFTVRDPAGGNEWHLYTDSNQQTIIEMSQSAAGVLKIANC